MKYQSEIQGKAVIYDNTFSISLSKRGMSIETGRFNKAGQAKATVYPTMTDLTPIPGDTAKFYIDDTKVFEGTVDSVEKLDEGGYNVTAFNALHDLKNQTYTQSFQGTNLRAVADNLSDNTGVDIVINADQEVLEELRSEDEEEVQTANTSAIEVVTDSQRAEEVSRDMLYPEFQGRRADKVVRDVAEWLSASYWVDENNTVNIGVPDVSEYLLLYMTKRNVGDRAIPYQSVKVVGVSPASRTGEHESILLTEERPVAFSGTGQPVFEYETDEAWTDGQVQAIADAIYREFRRRRKSGIVEFIGRPEIRPLDVVKVPGEGGTDAYIVDSITHDISTSGFLTTVNCGAAVY